MKLLALFMAVAIARSAIERTDSKKLQTILEENDVVFLKIFAPWCEISKSFAPIFKELSERKDLSHVKFAEINSEEDKEVMNQFKITGLPGIFVVTKDVKIRLQYLGPIEKQPINDFVKDSLLKKVEVLTTEKIQELKKEEEYIGHAVYCGEQSETFEKAKTIYPTLDAFAFFSLPTRMCEKQGLKANEVTMIRKSGNKESSGPLTDYLTAQRFMKFGILEPLNPFSMAVVGVSIGYQVPMLVLISKQANPEAEKVLRDLGSSKAKHFFINVHNKLETTFEREYAESLTGRSDLGKKSELFIFFLGREIVKYRYPHETINAKQVHEFILKFADRSLEKHLVSEDDESMIGPVKKVTTNNFEKFTTEPDRFKLLLFHTLSCQGCKEAISILESLAKEFSEKEKDFDFGSVNVAKNEFASVRNVPSLAFYPKKSGADAIFYEGALDGEKIRTFVIEQLEKFGKKAKKDSDL